MGRPYSFQLKCSQVWFGSSKPKTQFVPLLLMHEYWMPGYVLSFADQSWINRPYLTVIWIWTHINKENDSQVWVHSSNLYVDLLCIPISGYHDLLLFVESLSNLLQLAQPSLMTFCGKQYLYPWHICFHVFLSICIAHAHMCEFITIYKNLYIFHLLQGAVYDWWNLTRKVVKKILCICKTRKLYNFKSGKSMT